jgi:hypothetical protein
VVSATRQKPTLVVFLAGERPDDSQLERLVAGAQIAATYDLLLRAADSGAYERAVLVTEDPKVARGAGALGIGNPVAVVNEGTDAPFHFGRRLAAVVAAQGLERVVYVGGGALALAGVATLERLALAVSGEGPCVYTNNLFSADLAAFHPASALERIDLPEQDNDLAWLLHYRAGLPHAAAPRTLDTNFDIDTPTDVAILRHALSSGPLHGVPGPHLAAYLERAGELIPELSAAVERASTVMATRRSQVLFAGRLSALTWRRLELNLPSQTRVISEERGMRASGREARGQARSVLGLYADLVGPGGLVRVLEQTCDTAFLDTRVLFAHRRLTPTRADRFASDALRSSDVTDVWVRELTQALAEAAIPVVPGGHSLMSGGVWALSEQIRGMASATG